MAIGAISLLSFTAFGVIVARVAAASLAGRWKLALRRMVLAMGVGVTGVVVLAAMVFPLGHDGSRPLETAVACGALGLLIGLIGGGMRELVSWEHRR